MTGKTLQDRIRGSLIAGAAGDALGYYVEFKRYDAIVREFGEGGIRAYRPFRGMDVAAISDDTQMTLFTADGLLGHAADQHVGRAQHGRAVYVYRAYQDWYATQWGDSLRETDSHLMQEKRLFAARAPGNTCMSAICSGRMGSIDSPFNKSKGCGGVMRVAPLGLMAGAQLSDKLCVLGAELAAITHGHPLGYIPAAMLTHIVARAAYREDDALTLEDVVRESVEMTERMFSDMPEYGRAVVLTNRAIELAKNDRSDLENIRQLGEGWVGEEALAIAVYCCLRHADDLSAALAAAVNHDGDSDSTGAVAGNILGAWIGFDAIPAQWKQGLELSDFVLDMADDLYTASRMLAGEEPPQAFMERYAGRRV
ncbi:MAG: ADP-ribosylglycohydrolase family protein [Clostridia bacterium]|nr:ADP-ribosylglycohydrolase family protein [Clostridia bacterium]